MLLTELPLDVLELVCSDLDAHSAVACGLVCRLMHRVVTSSLPVQYNIGLAMRGMRQGLSEAISLAERLKNLERLEVAWREGSWKETFRHELRIPTHYDHVCHADEYVLTWIPEDGQVHIVRLPSPLRGIALEEYRWEFIPPEDVDPRRRIITLLDPPNNLAMFVVTTWHGPQGNDQRLALHPFELSSGNTPAAMLPHTTVVLQEKRFTYWKPVLRGELLLMELDQSDESQGIMVYNWVTQKRVLLVRRAMSFVTFLDDNRIIASFLRKVKLQGAYPRLRIYNLSELDTDGQARATHDFDLPLRSDIKLEPGWFRIGRECGYPAYASGGSYFSDDDEAVVYFSPSVMIRRKRYTLEMYLWMSEIGRIAASLPGSQDTIVIPWSTWGHAARLALQPSQTTHVMPDVVGTRGYTLCKDEARSFHVYDHHRARVRRARSQPSTDAFTIKQYPPLDLAVLREGEIQPGSPAIPLSSEHVDHLIKLPIPSSSPPPYEFVLSGDVILVREQTEKYHGHTKAIAAYSLV